MNASGCTLTVRELRECMAGMGPNTLVRVLEYGAESDVLGVTTGVGGIVHLEIARDVDLQEALDVLQSIADGKGVASLKARQYLEVAGVR
jgi:hypothetical protein